MFKLATHIKDKPIMLAPMEEVTDISYRMICKKMGADVVMTEFINSNVLLKEHQLLIKSKRPKISRTGFDKMEFLEQERPIGIQIYGNDIENMLQSALLAEQKKPDFIDINAGCWVKKVSSKGAGAGLLKDPQFMQKMIAQIVENVNLPVTVKTRIGWDEQSINIIEVAQRLEEVGINALIVHCRTREQGHSGKARWEWIDKIKQKVSIPIILNGGIETYEDALDALNTQCDGIMIARGAVGTPWIFKQVKDYLLNNQAIEPINQTKKIDICLLHLKEYLKIKPEPFGIYSFRRFYAFYLKGIPNFILVRNELMNIKKYTEIEKMLIRVKGLLQ